MRAHIIENGRVANTIVVDSLDVFPDMHLVDAEQGGKLGDQYDEMSGVFTTQAPPATVPERVTRRQARQALLLAGLLDHVQPAIDGIADATQRALAQIEWDDSQEFERHRALVVAIGSAIGCDAAALDALFISAARL
jgi:hypothetical protein